MGEPKCIPFFEDKLGLLVKDRASRDESINTSLKDTGAVRIPVFSFHVTIVSTHSDPVPIISPQKLMKILDLSVKGYPMISNEIGRKSF